MVNDAVEKFAEGSSKPQRQKKDRLGGGLVDISKSWFVESKCGGVIHIKEGGIGCNFMRWNYEANFPSYETGDH